LVNAGLITFAALPNTGVHRNIAAFEHRGFGSRAGFSRLGNDICCFMGIWLLERYLRRREKRQPFSKQLARRIRYVGRKPWDKSKKPQE
jgi:hypothetical protein